jgi:anaerobic selenocysteine-containing dehydrogenase
MVRVTSRRGTVDAPAHIDRGLRAGVVFMTLHFPDEIATNFLTINATDPRSGTAEFKACAVRVEPIRHVPSFSMRRAEPSAAHQGGPFAAAGDD